MNLAAHNALGDRVEAQPQEARKWAASYAWKLRNKQRVNTYKRAKRAEVAALQGRTPRKRVSEQEKVQRQYDSLCRVNAGEAWRYWLLIKGSDAMIAQYFECIGKPWSNPRLSDAEAYRIRYSNDEMFAKRERARMSRHRMLHPGRAAMWGNNGKRWWRAAQSEDGTVTKSLLVWLQQQSQCSYCLQAIRDGELHIDHVWPLAKGGQHTADNLVAACASCNRAKRDKLPLQWLCFRGSLRALNSRGCHDREKPLANTSLWGRLP